MALSDHTRKHIHPQLLLMLVLVRIRRQRLLLLQQHRRRRRLPVAVRQRVARAARHGRRHSLKCNRSHPQSLLVKQLLPCRLRPLMLHQWARRRRQMLANGEVPRAARGTTPPCEQERSSAFAHSLRFACLLYDCAGFVAGPLVSLRTCPILKLCLVLP